MTGAPSSPSELERLKRRADFRAAAAGTRAPGKALVLQARQRADDGAVRVGFTVSRQVGNAVVRNRVRRRLREVVRLTPPDKLRAGHDYVLIGRRAALDAPFTEIVHEFAAVLGRVHAPGRRDNTAIKAAGGLPQRSLHEAGSPAASPPQSRQRPRRGRRDA